MALALVHKYDIGQRVHHISRSLLYRADPCLTCHGEKTITLDGERFRCPRCEGKGTAQKPEWRWLVSVSGCVGQIQATLVAAEQAERAGVDLYSVKYMLDATGVVSGSVYSERDVFPTLEDAEAECKRRNDNPDGWEVES